MGFRFAIWKLEAKMLGLVLVEALTICLVLMVALVAGYWTFMFRGSMATFLKILAAAAGIAFSDRLVSQPLVRAGKQGRRAAARTAEFAASVGGVPA